jgi:hypothetical protein
MGPRGLRGCGSYREVPVVRSLCMGWPGHPGAAGLVALWWGTFVAHFDMNNSLRITSLSPTFAT